VGKSEVTVQDTKDRHIDDVVSVDVLAENIQIMKKELTSNIYPEAWINKNNKVMISEDPYDCDISKLLPKSHVDENGYLVDKDGHSYDLTDADVIAEVPISAVQITDGHDNGNSNGLVISTIYKGDHYSYVVRTEDGHDLIVDDEDLWNMDDQVSLIMPEDKMKFQLKK